MGGKLGHDIVGSLLARSISIRGRSNTIFSSIEYAVVWQLRVSNEPSISKYFDSSFEY